MPVPYFLVSAETRACRDEVRQTSKQKAEKKKSQANSLFCVLASWEFDNLSNNMKQIETRNFTPNFPHWAHLDSTAFLSSADIRRRARRWQNFSNKERKYDTVMEKAREKERANSRWNWSEVFRLAGPLDSCSQQELRPVGFTTLESRAFSFLSILD